MRDGGTCAEISGRNNYRRIQGESDASNGNMNLKTQEDSAAVCLEQSTPETPAATQKWGPLYPGARSRLEIVAHPQRLELVQAAEIETIIVVDPSNSEKARTSSSSRQDLVKEAAKGSVPQTQDQRGKALSNKKTGV